MAHSILQGSLCVVAGFILAGCSTELTFRHRQALDSFVGQNRSAVIAALGQPTKFGELNGHELLVYDDHELKWMPGEPGVRNSDSFPIGPWVENAHCATTFRMSDGKVDAWRLQGNDCRDPQFPIVAGRESEALVAAGANGVNGVADYAHNSFTGRSIVNDGEFQSR